MEPGLLCIIDGAKGLRTAIQTAFGAQALVQHCQWHMRENVVRYLPKTQQAAWRHRLQQAYERPTYAEAPAALGPPRQELRGLNVSAVASLDEGLEETLTLHGLGLFPILGVSLKTTNCLESLNAQLGQLTDKMEDWRTSDQKQRWVAREEPPGKTARPVRRAYRVNDFAIGFGDHFASTILSQDDLSPR